MCGIVGYIGPKQAAAILMEELTRLEYRGYDSAGISILGQSGALEIVKTRGKLQSLKDKLSEYCPAGTIGIGHTRWATHLSLIHI